MTDLELMNHWDVATSKTIGSYGELQRVMQEVVPRLGLTSPFLMCVGAKLQQAYHR